MFNKSERGRIIVICIIIIIIMTVTFTIDHIPGLSHRYNNTCFRLYFRRYRTQFPNNRAYNVCFSPLHANFVLYLYSLLLTCRCQYR